MFASNRAIGAFAIAATLCFCQIAAGQDTVYIAKDGGKFIRSWGKKGINTGQLNFPNRMAVGKDGSLYVTNTYATKVQKFSATGKFLKAWGSAGSGNSQFLGITGVAIAPDGSVLVLDKVGGIPQGGRVKRFSTNGNFMAVWGSPGNGPGQFWQPEDIAVDGNGNVVICDQSNSRIQVYSLTGTFKKQWTTAEKFPDDIALGPDGTIFQCDGKNHTIIQYDQQGNKLNEWGSFGKGPGMFGTPVGLDISPGGILYVADSQFKWVQVYKTDGTYIGTFGKEGTGKGQFKLPADVAIGKDGSIYVSNNNRYNIQQFKSYVFEPMGNTVTLSGTVNAPALSSSDLQKLTVYVKGRDKADTKRKFTAEVSVNKDGSFTFTNFPIKGKYKILVKGFKKSDFDLEPKRYRGKANSSADNLDFELIAQ